MDLFRRKNKEDQKGFKCEYCNLKFDDKDRMKRHVRKAHSEKGVEICHLQIHSVDFREDKHKNLFPYRSV